MNDLEHKTTIVTGASRGLGKSIAIAFGKAGAKVACVATSKDNAKRTTEEIRDLGGTAKEFGCRVEKEAQVKTLFGDVQNEFGPADVLINNAGISKPTFTLDMTENSWNEHMDINCKSIFLCSKEAAKQMKKNGGGSIVNIGSILGKNAFPATLGYCASKAATDQMTRVLAIEWARYGIRVNCVAPGYVKTDLIEGLEAEGKLSIADLERRTPQRRLGTGEEISSAVLYVASNQASFMTGEIMVVDGGWSAFGYYEPRGS